MEIHPSDLRCLPASPESPAFTGVQGPDPPPTSIDLKYSSTGEHPVRLAIDARRNTVLPIGHCQAYDGLVLAHGPEGPNITRGQSVEGLRCRAIDSSDFPLRPIMLKQVAYRDHLVLIDFDDIRSAQATIREGGGDTHCLWWAQLDFVDITAIHALRQ